jgi:predicted ATPase/DNA-binding CsgD family transcriptional regulator
LSRPRCIRSVIFVTRSPWREAEGLPSELTSFVGRRQLTAAVKRALSASRLVTLVGPGGVGKSRLALHVARAVRCSCPDGAFLVELGTVRDSAQVVSAVAATLGLADESVLDLETALVDYLIDKRLLLVLDNCEHVLAGCGDLMSVLLPSAPGLRVLATSREPLGVARELLCRVPPLSVPSAKDGDWSPASSDGPAKAFEAVALFEDRAAAVAPGFTVNPENEASVVRLCQRLDGLPLALELAAVRVRLLSVDQVLARMERRFQLLTTGNRAGLPRHQTLRAAVDWSYELCSETERLAWARCTVFAGDFGLDEARCVCSGDGLTSDDVLAAMTGLAEKSVLGKTEHEVIARYAMLETIRQYGAERLAETGERDRLRRRHRDHYLRLAEHADASCCGARQAELVRTVTAERSNLFAALDYCLSEPGEARTGLRLGAALWFYWLVCGFVRDGRNWLDRMLAADPEPTAERVRALWATAWLSEFQGDIDHAVAALTESRDLAGSLGRELEPSIVNIFLGEAESLAHDYDRAAAHFGEALARHRASDGWSLFGLMGFVAWARTCFESGRTEQATSLLEEGESICGSLGESWVLSWVRWQLGVIRWAQGDSDRALASLRESLRGKRDLGDQVGLPFCVDMVAGVAGLTGDARRAAVLYGAAEGMWRPVGRPLYANETLLGWRRQAIERTRMSLGAKEFEAAFGEGVRLPQCEVLSYALGEKELPPAAAVRASRGRELTKRERQVAELVAAGKSNREIAACLVISQRTAESHIEHILGKLGFTSRGQVASWFSERRRRRRR